MGRSFNSKTERIGTMKAARLGCRVPTFALLAFALSCPTSSAAGPEENVIGQLRIFEGHTDLARCLAVSQDSRYLLSGGHDRSLRLWDLGNGKTIWRAEGPHQLVRAVALSPNGKEAMSVGQEGFLCHWDAKTGKALREPTPMGTPITSVVYSADGKRALLGLDDQTLRLWDVGNWKELRRFTGHSSFV